MFRVKYIVNESEALGAIATRIDLHGKNYQYIPKTDSNGVLWRTTNDTFNSVITASMYALKLDSKRQAHVGFEV